MATTIVALHLAGNIATIGHVGDSRLYRLDPKGNLYRETQIIRWSKKKFAPDE